MPGGSIYVPQTDQLHGLSPQVMYEQFWHKEAKERWKMRGLKAAAGVAVGVALGYRFGLSPVLAGIVLGLLVGVADAVVAWWSYESTAVWRGRRRGETITAKRLRRRLGRRGYRILGGRAVPGQASVDHLVIGPGGVWIVDNESWSPDTEIATYGERLFLGEKYGSKEAAALVGVAGALAEVLGRESGIPVVIEPLVAVHCGKLVHGTDRRRTVTAEGVTLMRPRHLASWILGAPNQELDDSQVEALARTAARVLRRMR
ncbi:NERD domain-containing protein [Planomonospora sp. ID67723]|uniref:NERD domain-containing protein n=1 Tax=Planomonospora sp. ID67723 TaxID=2738134 RepID=UPI0018C3A679|nr:NERD domain-containing protein [Planomonospora sp. ID67723]MBG0832480.1 NERD domain-containing protein [Planomonospora sp. ID67723]